MKTKYLTLRQKRLFKLIGAFFSFIFVVFIRLFYLQIDQADTFTDLGKRNFLRTEVIEPLRGNIYDCNGVLLAANKPIFDLYWQGAGNAHFPTIRVKQLQHILNVVQISVSESSIMRAERFARPILLKKNISFDEVCRIREQFSHCNNLVIKNRFERYYPFGTLASHVLGYLSRAENVGRGGLEKIFQAELCGQSGYKLSIINSTGRELALKESKQAQMGSSLKLTLDVNLQALAESLFDEGQSGVFILMDPETGALRTLVSYPNFNPNIFLHHITEKEWKEKFSVNSPFLNRITSALYPPASIFKLVTVTAGLEEGIINADSKFECRGYVKFGKRKHWCIRHWGHGHLTPKYALAFSCNIPCYEIGKRINIDSLSDYAFRFGLGYKTNFLLPEKSGLVPTSLWKAATKEEQWWPGETLSASIGQSYLLVTPLQIARMISSICSGYLVKPRILEDEEIEKDTLQVSDKTLKFLQDAMHFAVQKGTGRRLRYLKDFDIHLKTGTAQTCSLQKQKTVRAHYEHAWLAAFFKYKSQKPLTLVVLLEHVGAALPAVRIAENFLRGYRSIENEKAKLAQLMHKGE